MLRTNRSAETASGRPAWLLLAIVVVALGALVATGCSGQKGAGLGGPEGAVQRMFEATAVYDAQGILDNATHSSMTATDVVAFKKQAADQKALYGSKPYYKDIKITSTTYPDPKDTATAVVKLSAQWLSDPANGTYTQRNETVTVLLKDGTWLVKLY
jgi:hypothetical protein